MCDYKRIRKWLIIIPFFVMHVFGAPKIISNLFISKNNSKDMFSKNFFNCNTSSDDETGCKSEFCGGKNDRDSFFEEGSGDLFFKNFVDKFGKNGFNYSKEIVVCDNRIDSLDKNFSETISMSEGIFDQASWSTCA